MWRRCSVREGYGNISSAEYLGLVGSTSVSKTRASAQRFCHLASICCGSYSATRSYPLLRPRLSVLDDFLARLTVVEERPSRPANATIFFVFGFVRRPLRKAAATLFFADAVSMEKPFVASGAWSFRPANSQRAATLRRSAPECSTGGLAGDARPGKPSGAAGRGRARGGERRNG